MNTVPSVRPPVEDYRHLRGILRKAMPPEAFEPQPLRGVVAFAQVPFMIGLGALVTLGAFPWWGNLLAAFVLSQNFVAVGFAAHEALHKSVFRSRFWEDALGWVGFAPWLVTPGTWRAWHVQAHHGGANIHGRDPDILPLRSQHGANWFWRLFHHISAGSGSLLSYVSFLVFFTAQGQLFLWRHCDEPQNARLRMNRARERACTVALACGWIALGVAIGPVASLYVIVIPMLLSNATLMVYIATNHWLQPASHDDDNPFINTASVATAPIIDFFHLNFSFHQEHHIFPSMSPRYAPLLRETLRRVNPAASIVYPHLAALLALYRRPPMYADDDAGGHVFVDLSGDTRVPTVDIRAALTARGDTTELPAGA